MASKGFTINRTDHFGITVKSISQSLLFWEGLLGGQVLSIQHMEMSPQLNIVGLTDAVIDAATIELADGTRIELLEYSAPADRKVFKPRGCDVGSVHIALDVTGSDALIEEAAKLGWEAVGPPQRFTRADGTVWTAIYMFGPDGETVELFEKMDKKAT